MTEEGARVVLAYDYPFWDLMGTMFVFFFWVIWIWILVDVSPISSAGTTSAAARRCSG